MEPPPRQLSPVHQGGEKRGSSTLQPCWAEPPCAEMQLFGVRGQLCPPTQSPSHAPIPASILLLVTQKYLYFSIFFHVMHKQVKNVTDPKTQRAKQKGTSTDRPPQARPPSLPQRGGSSHPPLTQRQRQALPGCMALHFSAATAVRRAGCGPYPLSLVSVCVRTALGMGR